MSTDDICKLCGKNKIATGVSKELCYNCWASTEGETRRKQSESAKNRHAREKKEKDEKAKATGRKFDYGEYEPVNILHPENFDLEEEYRKIRSINLSSEGEYYNEKFSFALWLMADPLTRKPENEAGCARVLGVVQSTLTVWNQSGEMLKVRNDAQDYRTKYWGKELWRMRLLEGMRRGDKDATKSFEKYYLEKDDGVINDDRFTTQEDVDEADKIIEMHGCSPNGATSTVSQAHTDAKIGEQFIKKAPINTNAEKTS